MPPSVIIDCRGPLHACTMLRIESSAFLPYGPGHYACRVAHMAGSAPAQLSAALLSPLHIIVGPQ